MKTCAIINQLKKQIAVVFLVRLPGTLPEVSTEGDQGSLLCLLLQGILMPQQQLSALCCMCPWSRCHL